MRLMMRRLRKMIMAKNAPKKGRSARNGNAPAPYTKYAKTPYKYSTAYHTWRSNRLAGRSIKPVMENRENKRELMAAE